MELLIEDHYSELSYFAKNFIDSFDTTVKLASLAAQAEDLVRENFESELQHYNLGLGVSFQDVLNARLGMQTAILKRLEADRAVKLARISLARTLSEGLFEEADSEIAKSFTE